MKMQMDAIKIKLKNVISIFSFNKCEENIEIFRASLRPAINQLYNENFAYGSGSVQGISLEKSFLITW